MLIQRKTPTVLCYETMLWKISGKRIKNFIARLTISTRTFRTCNKEKTTINKQFDKSNLFKHNRKSYNE